MPQGNRAMPQLFFSVIYKPVLLRKITCIIRLCWR